MALAFLFFVENWTMSYVESFFDVSYFDSCIPYIGSGVAGVSGIAGKFRDARFDIRLCLLFVFED